MKKFEQFINESQTIDVDDIGDFLDAGVVKSMETLKKQQSKRLTKKFSGKIFAVSKKGDPVAIEKIEVNNIDPKGRYGNSYDIDIFLENGERIKEILGE